MYEQLKKWLHYTMGDSYLPSVKGISSATHLEKPMIYVDFRILNKFRIIRNGRPLIYLFVSWMIFHNNCLCYCNHVEIFCDVFLVPKIDSSVHNIKHKSCNGKENVTSCNWPGFCGYATCVVVFSLKNSTLTWSSFLCSYVTVSWH